MKKNIQIPAYLSPGSTIGMVCPSGYMEMENVRACIETLQAWGYQVMLGKTVGSKSANYFSGTDEERLADFQELLDHPEVDALLCARGGYGLSRIIDRIDFSRFRKKPKWVIGFSDITLLHCHLLNVYGIASLHAPMAGAFRLYGARSKYVQSLRSTLSGERIEIHCKPHRFNKNGKAEGILVGGNLSLFTHCIGTPSDTDTRNKILFLEDVGEYVYQVDRMMYQLKRSGKLTHLAGLVVGGFTDAKDTTRPFGQNSYQAIRDVVAEYNYPVCFGFPVSHEKENWALKVGVSYRFQVNKQQVSLLEL